MSLFTPLPGLGPGEFELLPQSDVPWFVYSDTTYRLRDGGLLFKFRSLHLAYPARLF